jgi:NAD(P)-dependent dehydrogenase (short-subunit alcohol dehydrogenase family)
MSDSRVVLISGAASGIGRRIAERFLELGDEVHICDSSASNTADFLAANPAATATVADVSKPQDVDRVYATLLEQHDHLDLLINNAGIAGPSANVEDCDDGEWDNCIQVNLSGTFYMMKRAVPLLKKARKASVINMASTAALMGCPLRSPYVASKWAQIGLTKTWAMELGPEGIRVNAVCPTSVDHAASQVTKFVTFICARHQCAHSHPRTKLLIQCCFLPRTTPHGFRARQFRWMAIRKDF